MKAPARCLLAAVLVVPALARAQTRLTASEEAVQLNPFEVVSDRDDSYGAVNSNSVTRFNAELSHLPVSADIFTQSFMKDIAATSVETMIQNYSAAAGLSAVDAANVGAQIGDHVAHNYLKLNGFNTAALQRDSLMPVGPLFNPGSTAPGVTSNFDVERVEVIMGPQALLYSAGGPGGVVNIVSKQARFNTPAAGTLEYRIDQYGSKEGQVDFNVGANNFAVRVALVDNDDQTRRVNIGYHVLGGYVQLAARLFHNTTIRLNLEQTSERAFLTSPPPQIALSGVSGDSRANDTLSYLLATNQTGATANATTGAANTAGAILGGTLNWGNVDSLGGWLGYEDTKTTNESINIQTNWTPQLSSELALGYSDAQYAFRNPPSTLYAPTNSSNPTGTWALGSSPSETDEPAHTKAIRFSVLHHADLFDGRAQTQTIAGADFVGSRAYSIAYSYWQADANFAPVRVAPILNATGTSNNNGRTKLPTQYYPIGGGFLTYPWFPLGATRVTFGGVNYIRMPTNERNPALVSGANPLGTSSASGLNEYNIVNNKGYFLENMTQWMDKRLTTLLGIRANDGFDSLIYVPPQAYRVAHSSAVDFDAGANYQLNSWLAPYFNVSNVSTLPSGMFPDPAGVLPKPGRGIGEEVGFKFHSADSRFSGSLAYYHSHGANELFSNSTLEDAISPNGLNGRGNASSYFALNHTTDGVTLILTANPVRNWRIRFNAGYQMGRLTNSGTYATLYNDQFYENPAGQVTYADGSLVYVNPTAFSSKTPVLTSTSPGATPLTVAMMNDPKSIYYANPVNPSGAILSSSSVATVLKVTDPTHGPILTGAVDLPISQIQITPAFGMPGLVQAFRKGDRSLGTPLVHTVFTNLYTFDTGCLKGLELGGSINTQYKTVAFYYLVNGFGTANPVRQPFYSPNSTTIDPIIGYTRRFRRLTFETQLNISNVFNHYDVVIIPSQATGYTTVANLSAAFFGQPRLYRWTNRISF